MAHDSNNGDAQGSPTRSSVNARASVLSNLGVVCYLCTDFTKALDYQIQAVDQIKLLLTLPASGVDAAGSDGQGTRLSSSFDQLANIYMALARPDLAISTQQEG